MTCILCLERIKNPHCFPELSTIVLGVVVYFCSNIIYICIKIIILILKGMFWILKNKTNLINHEKMHKVTNKRKYARIQTIE